jgi:hypothetical protein
VSTPEIGLYPDATPDEHIAYSMGWNTATAIARTEAFAAIRSAAEIARTSDKVARRYAWAGDPQAYAFRIAANDVRRAIRAAIGSEKQS